MADAPIDSNSRQGLTAASSADGKTPVRLYADPTTHRLLVSSSGSGSASVNTTDATQTTLATIAIPSSTTVMIQAFVVARRTGGSSGTAEDAASYIVASCYKNVAGTATEVGETSIFSAEDQPAWNCTFNASSSNTLLQVTGAANNNISWLVTYQTYSVSS